MQNLEKSTKATPSHTTTTISKLIVKLICISSIATILAQSCSPKPKLSPLQKYKQAIDLYADKEYYKASQVFIEIIVPLSGKAEEIDARFYLGMCYYNRKEYIKAADVHKEFYDIFSTHKKAEDALYYACESLYNESPESKVDQTITYEALDYIQIYIEKYPNGKYINKINAYHEILHDKLAQKDFDNLMVHYNLGNLKATIVSCNNFFIDHPQNKLHPEVLYIKIDSLDKLCTKKAITKTESRDYQIDIINSCETFIASYPEKNRYEQVKNIYTRYNN